MKKNIFAVLFLGFFVCAYGDIDKTPEDKVAKCDDPKILALAEERVKGILQLIFNEGYLSDIKRTINFAEKYKKDREKYKKDLENYFNSIKVEFSSLKTAELYDNPFVKGSDIILRKCKTDVSITFPEAPQSLREIQEFRVNNNLIKEFRILEDGSFTTSFNGDTHKVTGVIYGIKQIYDPNLIKQEEPNVFLDTHPRLWRVLK